VASKFPLILAHRSDKVARRLVGQWARVGARLLVPKDLSEPGWRYHLGAKGPSYGVANGRRFTSSQIGGVLIRLPRVSAEELQHIEVAEREYVAAEMTAFLAAWLSSLPCPLLTRPTPVCLFGPNWKPEHWVRLATQIGLPARPSGRGVPSDGVRNKTVKRTMVTLTVVGNRCFGVADESLKRDARRLAQAATVELLDAHFDGPHRGSPFIGADPSPDVLRPDAREAVLELLSAGLEDRRLAMRVTS
jgi:hypothetical protein